METCRPLATYSFGSLPALSALSPVPATPAPGPGEKQQVTPAGTPQVGAGESLDLSVMKPSVIFLRSRLDPIFRETRLNDDPYTTDSIRQVTPVNLTAEIASTGFLLASSVSSSLAAVPVAIDGGKGLYNLVRGLRTGNKKQETEGLVGFAKSLLVAGTVLATMIPGGITGAIIGKTILSGINGLYGYLPRFRNAVNRIWDRINRAVPERLRLKEVQSDPMKPANREKAEEPVRRGPVREAIRRGVFNTFEAIEHSYPVRKTDELLDSLAGKLTGRKS